MQEVTMTPRYLIRNLSFLAVLAGFAFAAGCASNGQGGAARVEAQTSNDEVGTRGVAQAGPPQGAQLPTWPQKFEVQGPEVDSYGFAVTQPGPIAVDLQWKGVPIEVMLISPASPPMRQVGNGSVHLEAQATAQDVARSLFWRVQIRSWCEEDCLAAAKQRAGSTQPTSARAAGSIVVRHPPVDQSAVQRALAGRRKQPTHQEQEQAAAQVVAKVEQAFHQHKAQFEQHQMQRRAALMAPLQPILNQMQAGIGVRPRGLEETPSGDTASASAGDVTSRGVIMGTQLLIPMLLMAPAPVIASLNVTQGQPGDPVMITGSGFGNAGGEVHFIIAPGQDFPASGVTWGDTQIFATVPDTSGILGFNGMVYIRRATDKAGSNLVPFRFNPSLELRQVKVPADYILQQFDGINTYTIHSQGVTTVSRINTYWFWGPKGNDQFFLNTRLKNGWTVVQAPSVFLPHNYATAGGAYLDGSYVGTDWPYVNVRFWVNGGSVSFLDYAISVLIQGPKGVPDGLVVP
jgi:hypothetical protein